MSCLCHKLTTRRYSEINESEAHTLKRTWEEAPHLFYTALPAPKRKKRLSDVESREPKHPRTLSDSCSNSLVQNGPREHPSQDTLILPPSFTINLEKTYNCKNAGTIFQGDSGQLDQESGPGGRFVRIFLAIERVDQNIEIQQLIQRVCCYVLAQLHIKGTSVDQIVSEVQNALPLAQNAKNKVYRFLHIGSKWVEILELFASITGVARQQLTGLLCLLQSGSSWERSSIEKCQLALSNLYKKTDIYKRTLDFTPSVNKIVNQILLEHSFLDETRKFISPSKLVLSVMPKSQPSRSSPTMRSSRALRTVIDAEPDFWTFPSLKAASEALHRSSNTCSEDANILLVLLCFLATREKIPVDLLFRGATPRKRWNVDGKIEEMDPNHAGLVPKLGLLLSHIPRLSDVFNELALSSVVSKNSDQTYTVAEAVTSRVLNALSSELHSFWRCQALIVAYTSIPWKYIEPAVSNVGELFLPHLKHALQAYRDNFEQLPTTSRADLVLTLVEASRFPKMEWKRFAIAQANLAVLGVEDQYLCSRIAESESLLYRISGNIDRSVSALRNPSLGRHFDIILDKRMHSAIGYIAVQHALNGIQVEDLAVAEKSLDDWRPVGQSTSLMEQTVLFRKHMMLGRILRFGGRFSESLTHLERSRNVVGQNSGLNFDEDLRDLTCDLADTLRELDDPITGEHHLRTELARQGPITISRGTSAVELSLAEALFAQRRFKEAETLCLDIQSRPGLLKFEKLRLYITLAKLRHVVSDDNGAFFYWAKAMVAISNFTIETGGTNRTIVTSICDILGRQGQQQLLDQSLQQLASLGRQGQQQLLDQSLQQLASLDKLAKPGSVWCWIAGLRHWLEFLQSRDTALRSRM